MISTINATQLRNAPVFSAYFTELSGEGFALYLDEQEFNDLHTRIENTYQSLVEAQRSRYSGQLSSRCSSLLSYFGSLGIPLPASK